VTLNTQESQGLQKSGHCVAGHRGLTPGRWALNRAHKLVGAGFNDWPHCQLWPSRLLVAKTDFSMTESPLILAVADFHDFHRDT